MTKMYVIGEDQLCCALGERLVSEVLGWSLVQEAINTKGVTRLQSGLPRYAGLARIHPVLCIADTDGRCPVQLAGNWLPTARHPSFLLRFAVTEAESWLLADRSSLSQFFGLTDVNVAREPDRLPDAKREMLKLALKSRRRELKREMVSSSDLSKPGPGYNVHLRDFVLNHWSSERAAENSPSLAKAIARLQGLAL